MKFFSILMDGSTDVNKIDDKLFLVHWCDIDGIASGKKLFCAISCSRIRKQTF